MAGGEHDALAELYDRFSRPLYATALRILNDATEAQDVVHDVFITLWEKSSAFAVERGTAFSWAVTLTRNRSIDRLRSRRRRAELLEQSFPADLGYDEDAGTERRRRGLDSPTRPARCAPPWPRSRPTSSRPWNSPFSAD